MFPLHAGRVSNGVASVLGSLAYCAHAGWRKMRQARIDPMQPIDASDPLAHPPAGA
jgi:hypothetical protein